MQIETDLADEMIAGASSLPSAVKMRFKHQSLIYSQRELGKTFVVARGFVKLTYLQMDGKRVTRMLLGPGAMFGDMPFQTGLFNQNEQAISNGATRILELSRTELQDHADLDYAFRSLLMSTFATQLQSLDRRLQWQLISPLRARVATALIDLLCFSGSRCGHGHQLDIRLTHEDFAELIVAARPAVSAVLSSFRDQQLIDYTRSFLCLLDMDGLQAIAG